jgi:hypothetical protein
MCHCIAHILAECLVHSTVGPLYQENHKNKEKTYFYMNEAILVRKAIASAMHAEQ